MGPQTVLATEDTRGDTTPDATQTVHGERTDRIVDLQLVQQQNASHNQHTGHRANHYGRDVGDGVTVGRDPDQAGQGTVERHGQVRLLEQAPSHDHGYNGTGSRCQRRVHGDQHRGVSVHRAGKRQLASRVKPVPAHPQNEDAQVRQTPGCAPASPRTGL